MNNDRRKDLAKATALIDQMMALRDEAVSILESARDEEQDYFDNMPESFQSGDKGDRAQTAIDALDTAKDNLEGLDLDDILSSIDEAVSA